MKSNGNRALDDLGRIVVPKRNPRRTPAYVRGDPFLEIFTDREGEIILKKIFAHRRIGQFAGEYAESLGAHDGYLVLITDGDHGRPAVAKRDFGQAHQRTVEEIIGERKSLFDEKTFVKLTADDAGEYRQQAISTIIL